MYTSGSNKFGDTMDDKHQFTGSIQQSGSSANHYLLTGNVGIGTTGPDRLLHLPTGTAGSVTGNSNAPLVVETAGDSNIQLLAPNSSDEYILFGSNSGNRTYIKVDLNSTDANETLGIYVNEAEQLRIQHNTISGSSTSTGSFGVLRLANYNQGYGSEVLNTNFGVGAGDALTSGNWNTMIGNQAGGALTDGAANVIVGSSAGDATTSVSNTVLVGVHAGGNGNLTSAANGTIAIGYSAGYALTSGLGNVAIGSGSLTLATTAASNTAVGTLAGSKIVDGAYNTAVGYHALRDAPESAAHNTAV